MRHAGSIALRHVGHALRRRTRRKSIFIRMIEALQHSRQLEAARVHHRYRHLTARDWQGEPTSAAPHANQEESIADANRDNAPVHAIHRTPRRA